VLSLQLIIRENRRIIGQGDMQDRSWGIGPATRRRHEQAEKPAGWLACGAKELLNDQDSRDLLS